MQKETKVCVTGGTGYIGANLISKLLQKGYTVHTTLRNLRDESKVELLRRLPHGNDHDRLVLFQADIYNPNQFEAAIQGCHFVFHVATPKQYHQVPKKSISEAAIEGVKKIADYCIKSRTVRKLIYTASVVAASPMRDDGSGFKDFMDETCWTPLHLSFPYNNEVHENYTDSKTECEREILSYNDGNGNGNGLEVVSLACGLVGGDTPFLRFTPSSVKALISPLLDLESFFHSLRFLEELLAKIPIVHIDDVCDAHIFCIQAPSITGRFLLAASYVSSLHIANYYLQSYPHFHLNEKYLEGPKRDIKWASTKLTDKGFAYKYDMEMILDDSIRCARRMGDL